jgi:hypothetical protein
LEEPQQAALAEIRQRSSPAGGAAQWDVFTHKPRPRG